MNLPAAIRLGFVVLLNSPEWPLRMHYLSAQQVYDADFILTVYRAFGSVACPPMGVRREAEYSHHWRR